MALGGKRDEDGEKLASSDDDEVKDGDKHQSKSTKLHDKRSFHEKKSKAVGEKSLHEKKSKAVGEKQKDKSLHEKKSKAIGEKRSRVAKETDGKADEEERDRGRPRGRPSSALGALSRGGSKDSADSDSRERENDK